MKPITNRSRPGGRSTRVRSAVFEAVLHGLVVNGFEGLKVRDVAKRAGVNETSIYRRWRTRESLIGDALLDHSAEHIPVPDTGDVRGDLIELAHSVASYLDTPLGAALMRVLAMAANDPTIAQTREAFWDIRYEVTAVIVARAVARGELPATTNSHLVLETLIAPLHFRNLLTRQPLDQSLPEQLADFVLNGARGPTHQGNKTVDRQQL